MGEGGGNGLTLVDVRWQATDKHFPREAFPGLAPLTVRTAPTRGGKRCRLRSGYPATDADPNTDSHADTHAHADPDPNTDTDPDPDSTDAVQLAGRVGILQQRAALILQTWEER